ncbi:hypothetical protein H2199_003860 [Coniosporium tulheliwenetii]|uniref:Uncharacterized protein n=1 Tax=Coniosporium tulheliwenetii TaxID=3383036 RepID=A0ACC2Z8X8_9PEZI|nr:hypothetical protein H2199_003860 [Cladosporium sp. JES 115]
MAVAAAQQESGRQSVEDSWETWKFDLRVDALLAHVERQAVRQERERMLDMMRVRVQMRDNGPRGPNHPLLPLPLTREFVSSHNSHTGSPGRLSQALSGADRSQAASSQSENWRNATVTDEEEEEEEATATTLRASES